MALRPCRGLSIATAGLALLLGAQLPAQSRKEIVAPLPGLTGAFPVGTAVVYLVDSARKAVDLPDGRPITVQLWYPASAGAGPTAPYLFERGLLASMLRNGYYGVDSAALRAWGDLRTHSRTDAVSARGKHPLVAFSVGLGVARANYTSIAEELASHGEIVALVESPMQGFMVLPNGREVMDTAGKYGATAAHRQGVTDWAKDISFAFDALQAGRVPGPLRRVAESIDWTRVGAVGHSSGGLVAITVCETDARVRACVDMDGGLAAPDGEPLADFVRRAVSKPTLILRSQPLYDDTTFARRGITREQWTKQGAEGKRAFQELVARSKGRLRIASVAGTGHFSFTDAPFVMPSAITRFGGRTIRPARGWTIITTVLRMYFDSAVDQWDQVLTRATTRFPELTVDPQLH